MGVSGSAQAHVIQLVGTGEFTIGSNPSGGDSLPSGSYQLIVARCGVITRAEKRQVLTSCHIFHIRTNKPKGQVIDC